MKDWIKNNRILIAIFLLALVFRVVLFIINFSHQQYNLINTIHGDDGYYEISQGLIHGHGFTGNTTPPYTPNPLRPPLWPILIASSVTIFGSYWAVLVLEIIIGSLLPILGFNIARRFLDHSWAIAVAIILAIEPYFSLLSTILYTETAFTFFFMIFIIFLFRYIDNQTYRNVIWAGVFLGLATLIKPTVQYLPIITPLAVAFFLRKKLCYNLGKHLLVFLCVFFMLISPWLYRNYSEFGVWGMSAQPAFNLYVYLVPTVLSIDNNTSFAIEHKNFAIRNDFDVNTINLTNSKFYISQATRVLKDHKRALLKSVAITGITFFTHDGMHTVLQYLGIPIQNFASKPFFSLLKQPVELIKVISHYSSSPAAFIILMRLVWVLVTFLFLIGGVSLIRNKNTRGQTIIVVIIILYFTLTTAINGLGVNARFRVPVNALILSFAVQGLYVIKKVLSKHIPGHETLNNSSVL